MSFYVNLYTFSKEPNSTAQPTGRGTQYECVSNTPFDVLHPAIPLNLGNAANPTGYNYCQIPDFQNRYYWIRTWSWEDGLWVAHCDVDPLASWKTEIGSTNAYVLRAAADSDGTIVDTLYPASSPNISHTTIAKPWSVAGYSSGFYVVGVVGKTADTTYYFMTQSEYNDFMLHIFSDTFFTTVTGTPLTDQNMYKNDFNPIQYITSVKWFPGSIPAGTTTTIWLGYWDTTKSGRLVSAPWAYWQENYHAPRHPQATTRGQYLNGNPYSEYILDIPPFGRIPIDPTYLTVAGNYSIRVYTDYITGNAICRVICSQGELLNDSNCIIVQATVGIDVQISQVLYDYFGMFSSIASTLMAGATMNIGGMFSGLASIDKKDYPEVRTTGMNSGFSSFAGAWKLITKFTTVVAEDNTHRGRPLCQVRQLSTLSGYQLCTNVDIQIPATREEIDAIRGYLETGYYYE